MAAKENMQLLHTNSTMVLQLSCTALFNKCHYPLTT